MSETLLFKRAVVNSLILASLLLLGGVASAQAPSAPSKLTPRLDPRFTQPAARAGFGDAIVAVVDTEAITQRELDARVQSASQQLSREKVAMPPRAVLERQVLERLVIERVQLAQARDLGLKVDDAQVDRTLARLAEQNRLTVDQLRDRVEKQGVSFDRYREDVRVEILMSKLREREVDSKIQVSEAEVDGFLAEQRGAPADAQELRLAQILLRLPENADASRSQEVRAKADSLRERLKTGADFARMAAEYSDAPEALKGGDMGWRAQSRWPQLFIQAVEALQPGQISAVVQSPNGFHILKLVERRAAEAAVAVPKVAQTQVRHILLRVNEVVTSEAAQRRLTELRARIAAGDLSFEEAARQFSNDASAPQGGLLGWVYPGDTVPEFEAAMNALSPGEISQPVSTPFGWHLIQVADRRVQDVSTDRLRMAARAALRERKSDEAYEQWLRQLRDRAYVDLRLESAN